MTPIIASRAMTSRTVTHFAFVTIDGVTIDGDNLATAGTFVLAVAAVASIVFTYLTLRDERKERRDRAASEHARDVRRAHDDLGNALLVLVDTALEVNRNPDRRSDLTLAQIRARHVLKRARHPNSGDEYQVIENVIASRPETLDLHVLEQALNAIFTSSERVRP